MKPLKVAVCDDNPKERTLFHDMCRVIKERKSIPIKLKEYETGESMLFDLEDTRIMNTVDIVLLDINMPGKNGIDTARALREYGYQGAIIFITKSDEHWREAFDLKAFNYITKDKDVEERFVKTFLEAVTESEKRRDRTLLFSSLNETRQIEIASISHFEVYDHLVRVYYDNEHFEFISSLTKVESLVIGNDDFKRISRSYLVSLSHIQKFNENDIVMLNGKSIPVTPKYMKELKAAIG